jgi:hypothetical protein
MVSSICVHNLSDKKLTSENGTGTIVINKHQVLRNHDLADTKTRRLFKQTQIHCGVSEATTIKQDGLNLSEVSKEEDLSIYELLDIVPEVKQSPMIK